MLQGFIDDSREGNRTLVLAGYIATAEAWAVFSDEWKEMLDHFSLPAFKMSERGHWLTTKEGIENLTWFYRIIERHALVAVSCAVDVPMLEKVVCELGLPEKFTNPYHLAVKAIVNMTAQDQGDLGLPLEPIDFIFDEQTEKDVVREGWEIYINTTPSDTLALTGHEPIFRSDEKFLPLQAADFYAWWARKWHINGDNPMMERLAFPWPIKREIPRLVMEPSESDTRINLMRMQMVVNAFQRITGMRIADLKHRGDLVRTLFDRFDLAYLSQHPIVSVTFTPLDD